MVEPRRHRRARARPAGGVEPLAELGVVGSTRAHPRDPVLAGASPHAGRQLDRLRRAGRLVEDQGRQRRRVAGGEQPGRAPVVPEADDHGRAVAHRGDDRGQVVGPLLHEGHGPVGDRVGQTDPPAVEAHDATDRRQALDEARTDPIALEEVHRDRAARREQHHVRAVRTGPHPVGELVPVRVRIAQAVHRSAVWRVLTVLVVSGGP